MRFYPDRLKNPRRDKAIIAAAGPFSNLILGVIFLFIIKVHWSLDIFDENLYIVDFVIDVLYYWAYTNIGLFVFNMFPIPPLDGSHIFLSGLNLTYETETKIMQIGSGIFILLIILQYTAGINILPIGIIVDKIISFIL